MAVERIKMMGVPIDICSPDNLENEILELLAKPGTKQIVFLSLWDFLRVKSKGDYSDCVKNASLVLPVSKSILTGARFLKKAVPVRYNPFDAIIQILSILETHYKTLYMLGSNKKNLNKAESNVRATFPGLRIVGKCVGFYPKSREDDIIQAIHKAQPSLVLVSDGIKEKNCWSWNRRSRFSSSIFLYFKDTFGIFSGKIKRISEKTYSKGLEFFVELVRNPFKIFFIFLYVYYILKLIVYKFVKEGEF